MGTVVAVVHLTLDGVMQAPGRPDEDVRGGFEHGGWAAPYRDEVMNRVMGQGMASDGALLLGRRTYEDFAGFWPHQTDNPFTPVLDARTNYVVSTTLRDPLPWANSTLLAGDAVPEWAAAEVEVPPEVMAETTSRESAYARAALDLVEALVLRPAVGRRFPAVVIDVDDERAQVQLRDPAVVARAGARRRCAPGDEVEVEVRGADPVARRVDLEVV